VCVFFPLRERWRFGKTGEEGETRREGRKVYGSFVRRRRFRAETTLCGRVDGVWSYASYEYSDPDSSARPKSEGRIYICDGAETKAKKKLTKKRQ